MRRKPTVLPERNQPTLDARQVADAYLRGVGAVRQAAIYMCNNWSLGAGSATRVRDCT
jgi:hypothetical protein